MAKNILSTFLLIIVVSGEHCNREMKQGPYKLQSTNLETKFVSNIQLRATKVIPDESMSYMVSGYRSAWKSYCYNGGALDGNTGCYSGLVDLPPTEEELLNWEKKKKCHVGKSCVDCWGSDSEVCLKDFEYTEWVDHKELNKFENNNHFAYHTCNLDWRCGISISKIPIFIQCEYVVNNIACDRFYNALNGSKITINMNMETQYKVSGEASYLIKPNFSVTKTSVLLDCFYEPKSTLLMCHEPNNDKFLEMHTNKCSCAHTECYCVEEVPDLSKIKKDSLLDPNEVGEEANIEDLKNVIKEMHYDNLNMRYNLGIINSRFNEITKVIDALVNSLSNLDDRLIGNIMGINAQTVHMNSDTFFITPCIKPIKTNSNCYNGSIFSEGRWIANDDPSKCIKLNSSIPLFLLNFTKIHLPYLEDFHFTELTKNLPGWSFIAAEKSNLVQTMEYTRNGGKGTSMEDILGMPSGFISGSFHSIFVTFCVHFGMYILLGLLVVKIFLRVF